jgi:hypothetical protein
MIHLSLKKITIFTSLCLVFSLIGYNQNVAANTSGFEAGRIIDDLVFTHYQSMSVSQIQTFLNSKVPVCDYWGTNGSTSTSRRDYVLSLGETLPLTCLKEYTENGKSSAQIIYDAAHEFKINPQVILVLLQKEQALITDDWPISVQYRSATGYGCPDTAACDTLYYGFTNQVRNAANMFRKIMDASPTWYTPYKLGNNKVYYHPNASCGYTILNIQNRATQALYNYTPYQPNASALAAGYGTGDSCGAYGNRNFYLFFRDWFGSTHGAPEGSVIKSNAPSSGIYLVENGVKRPFSSIEAFYSHNYKWSNVVTVSDYVFNSIPTGNPITLNLVVYNKKTIKSNAPSSGIYLVENGVKRPFSSIEAFYSNKYKWSDVMTFSDYEIKAISSGQPIDLNISFYLGSVIKSNAPSSGIYLVENGVKRPFSSIEAFYSHNYKWSNVVTVSDYVFNSIPTGNPITLNLVVYNKKTIKSNAPSSGIYLVENGVKRPFSSIEAFYSNKYKWSDVMTFSDYEIKAISSGQPIDLNISFYLGSVIKSNAPSSGIYLVENGVKRPFSSIEAFYSHNYKWSNVVTVSDYVFNSIPTGNPIEIKT